MRGSSGSRYHFSKMKRICILLAIAMCAFPLCARGRYRARLDKNPSARQKIAASAFFQCERWVDGNRNYLNSTPAQIYITSDAGSSWRRLLFRKSQYPRASYRYLFPRLPTWAGRRSRSRADWMERRVSLHGRAATPGRV